MSLQLILEGPAAWLVAAAIPGVGGRAGAQRTAGDTGGRPGFPVLWAVGQGEARRQACRHMSTCPESGRWLYTWLCGHHCPAVHHRPLGLYIPPRKAALLSCFSTSRDLFLGSDHWMRANPSQQRRPMSLHRSPLCLPLPGRARAECPSLWPGGSCE